MANRIDIVGQNGNDGEHYIESPCINLCIVKGKKCIGCRRTLGEIRAWRNLPISDQKKIIERIKKEIKDEELNTTN